MVTPLEDDLMNSAILLRKLLEASEERADSTLSAMVPPSLKRAWKPSTASCISLLLKPFLRSPSLFIPTARSGSPPARVKGVTSLETR